MSKRQREIETLTASVPVDVPRHGLDWEGSTLPAAEPREGGEDREGQDPFEDVQLSSDGNGGLIAKVPFREGGDPNPDYFCPDCQSFHPDTTPCSVKTYRATLIPPSGNPATDRVVEGLAGQGNILAPRRRLPTVAELTDEELDLVDLIDRAKARIRGLGQIRKLLVKLDGQGLLPVVDPGELA